MYLYTRFAVFIESYYTKLTMKILIAPNSFKGTLNASMAAFAIAKGIRKVLPEINLKLSPISDGGDGLIDIALNVLGGQIKTDRKSVV